MNRAKLWMSIIVIAMVAIGPAMALGASSLYGITLLDNSGNSTLLQIDPSTGAATTLFTFPVPSTPFAMAYNAPANNFVILSGTRNASGVSLPELTIVDPITHATSSVPVTGLPSGQEGAQGIGYDPTLGTLLITFGPVNSNTQNRIAAVGLNGVVTQASTTLSLPDADNLAFDPTANGLRICDFNDDGVYAISNVFSSPSLTQLAPNPGDSNLGEAAYSDSGQLFIARTGSRDLYKLSGSSYVSVGQFGTATDVVGLAFAAVPEPSSVALVSVSGLALLRRRRRSLGLAIKSIKGRK